MKEIGGYFGLEQFHGREYYPDLVAVNNGRNALLYILKAREIEKVYLPYFLCDSVTALCDREGYAWEYYHTGEDFLPVFDKTLGPREYLYVVNYYGQITGEKVRALKERYGNMILDNAQAFFQRPVEDIDTIYSCRKFFGVPDGGYLFTSQRLKEELQTDVSKDRMKHVLGRFEGESASLYYGDFKENDRSFRTLELRAMSALTHNLLRAIDYDAAREKREQNYLVLAERLGTRNKLRLNMPAGPFAYPFYCENGPQVRKALAEKGIFVATLWPNVLQEEGAVLEKEYAENILPLPCDQRYDENDMAFVAKQVCGILDNDAE